MFVFLSFETENDKIKFEYIYEKYKKLLLHKSYLILNDYSLAEDATSEAYMRIYKNLNKIEYVDSSKTVSFLVTIVRNVSISMLNIKNKNITSTYENIEIKDDFNLEEIFISNEIEQNILKIIDELKEELKAPFLLKYAHDFSHKEIAKILNISENNVTVRIYRAKKKLAKLLDNYKKEFDVYE